MLKLSVRTEKFYLFSKKKKRLLEEMIFLMPYEILYFYAISCIYRMVCFWLNLCGGALLNKEISL